MAMASPSPSLLRSSTFKDPNPNPNSNSNAPPPNPLDSFATDPLFAPFLSQSFSSPSFSSAALSSGSAASTAELLHDAIRRLHLHLRHLLLSRHPTLLLHLSHLRHSHSLLLSLRSSLSSLTSSLSHLRREISEPRSMIKTHTTQLSNLHSAADLIHNTSRLLKLSSKLRSLMSNSTSNASKSLDLAKAAEMHREIEILYQERGLDGISVVEDEIRWLSSTGAHLRSEAIKTVEKGMDEMNQNDIWCGLQVFYNLGELRSTVDALVNKYKNIGIKRVGSALDVKAISLVGSAAGGPGGIQRSGTPQIGSGKRAGELLWERMGKCMDDLHRVMMAVWQLQTVLSKKRVPFTQVLFLHEVWQEGDPLLTDRVWDALVKAFATHMKSVFTASSFVKEVFTHGYPKLFTMIENLIERVSRDTDVRGVVPALSGEGKEQMVGAVDIFQTAFLAQCLSALTKQQK